MVRQRKNTEQIKREIFNHFFEETKQDIRRELLQNYSIGRAKNDQPFLYHKKTGKIFALPEFDKTMMEKEKITRNLFIIDIKYLNELTVLFCGFVDEKVSHKLAVQLLFNVVSNFFPSYIMDTKYPEEVTYFTSKIRDNTKYVNLYGEIIEMFTENPRKDEE